MKEDAVNDVQVGPLPELNESETKANDKVCIYHLFLLYAELAFWLFCMQKLPIRSYARGYVLR